MDIKLIIAIAVSEAISLYLLLGLWRRHDYLILKVLTTPIALIPFVGPLLYMFVTHVPPRQPKSEQDKPFSTSHMDSIGSANFTEGWQYRKKELQRKINELKNKT